MILIGCILLTAAISSVEPFQFNYGPSPAYGFNQPLLLPQQPPPLTSQQQYYTNQDPLQLNSNAQRSYQHLTPPWFNSAPQRHGPTAQLNRQLAQSSQVIQSPYQQQQQQPPYGQSKSPVASRLPPPIPIQNRPKATADADKDFLSSIQIIDTQGRLRQLKDFGLGGNGNQPHEPELERQLRGIFDLINRDLEHAAFLPLDVNSANQQIEVIQANQAPQIQAPHSITPSSDNIHQQQQSFGYSFKQPQQHQFQYLKPLRGGKTNSNQGQQVRSPAQTIRGPKQIAETIEKQRPIEHESSEQQKISEQEQVKAPVSQVQSEQLIEKPIPVPAKVSGPPNHGHELRIEPGRYEDQRPQIKQQKNYHPEQQPIQATAHLEQQHLQAPQLVDQQTQQQGFDDEPVPIKSVEHELTYQPKNKPHQAQVISLNKDLQGAGEIFTPQKEIHLPERTNEAQYGELQRDHVGDQTKAAQHQGQRQIMTQSAQPNVKSEGWVPIVQEKEYDQQKLIEPQSGEQEPQREDQGFEEQKQIPNQGGSQFEQQKNDPGLEHINNEPLVSNPVMPSNSLHPSSTKGQGKFNKFRKSITKIASSAKSKISVAQAQQTQQQTNAPLLQQERYTQKQEQVQNGSQESEQQLKERLPSQQKEEMPFQQQDDALGQFAGQQRQDVFHQQKELGSTNSFKQEEGSTNAFKSEQAVGTSTTTPKSTQRVEQMKGRRVKLNLANSFRTPIQKARDQQIKAIKQQQQQAQQKHQIQEQPIGESKQPSERPQTPVKADESRKVKEEVSQQNSEEQSVPVLSTTIVQEPTVIQEAPRQGFVSQQHDAIVPEQQEQYKQGQDFNQQLGSKQHLKNFPAQGDEISQIREDADRSKNEPSEQKEELNQQKEDLNQPKEDSNQQKEDFIQVKEEVHQQKEELPHQKTETQPQQEDISTQKEDQGQQREEVPQQKEVVQQPQETLSQAQVQVDSAMPQTDSSDEQANEKLENTAQPLDSSQQETLVDNVQPQQQPQQEQKSEETFTQVTLQQEKQQEILQDDKRVFNEQIQRQNQDEEQQSRPLNQEKQQISETQAEVQTPESKSPEEELAPTTTQRPPTRIRSSARNGPENRGRKDKNADSQKELRTENIAPTIQPKWRSNQRQAARASQRKQSQLSADQTDSKLQSRVRQNYRQGHQVSDNGYAEQQNVERYNEGYLNAHQLMDTYNPLQFEPERISSLNRAPQSSSQNTNVNLSSPGEPN